MKQKHTLRDANCAVHTISSILLFSARKDTLQYIVFTQTQDHFSLIHHLKHRGCLLKMHKVKNVLHMYFPENLRL